jgi:SAM-dependent methyltransferase
LNNQLAARWDAEYRAGRYADEPPLPFVATIVETLDAHPDARAGVGLYVGCGNGRNYLPLIDAGLGLVGLDVSPEALAQISTRRPELSERLVHADFRDFGDAGAFAYLIALQVFQHGGEDDAAGYFARAARLLRPGGLLFVRVNSASTEVYHRHRVVERHPLGGFTVQYEEGPKRDLLVHFYSRKELLHRTRADFTLVAEPREDVIRRDPPKTGSWAQWEAIWRRR